MFFLRCDPFKEIESLVFQRGALSRWVNLLRRVDH